MARIRTVKPDAWQDERLAGVSRDARLLWTVLLTLCDDEGRFRALPAVIFGHGYPLDDDALTLIPRWLDELEGAGLIEVYEVDGGRFGCFPKWGRHQRISKPTPSKLPPPPGGSRGIPGNPENSAATRAGVEVEVEVEKEGASAPVAEFGDAVAAIWQHYLAVIYPPQRRGPRPTLEAKRTRIIRQALKVRPADVILDAITGLSRSPHHNGENQQGTSYLDIRYALRGNGQRGETDEERIDRMAALARTPPIPSGQRMANAGDLSRFSRLRPQGMAA